MLDKCYRNQIAIDIAILTVRLQAVLSNRVILRGFFYEGAHLHLSFQSPLEGGRCGILSGNNSSSGRKGTNINRDYILRQEIRLHDFFRTG